MLLFWRGPMQSLLLGKESLKPLAAEAAKISFKAWDVSQTESSLSIVRQPLGSSKWYSLQAAGTLILFGSPPRCFQFGLSLLGHAEALYCIYIHSCSHTIYSAAMMEGLFYIF